MIAEKRYQTYLEVLLASNRPACTAIVEELLDDEITLKKLYLELFQASLYEIGDLWAANRISVAREHLVSALTETLLSLVQMRIFKQHMGPQKAVISCAANEYHQIGGKMVADILENSGWDSYFLGANTPVKEMISFIDEVKPELLGLSLTIEENLGSLKEALTAIKSEFPKLDIIVGGQAFTKTSPTNLKNYPGTHYIESLESLEKNLGGRC